MIQARDYSGLRGRLIGISDRMLDDHLALYARSVAALNAIEGEYPKVDWTRPSDGQQQPPPGVAMLLRQPIGKLRLKPEGVLEAIIGKVKQEALAAGLAYWPNVYLGDGTFWTTDRKGSVNVPWFLANPALWWLVNDRKAKYTVEEVERALRHELGHALGYAFRLYERPDWVALFGDFEQPYRDEFLSDPESTDFVKYLHRTGDKHYAQKHPDEDWAETFGTWLDPGSHWQEQYPVGTGARAKLDWLEALHKTGALAGTPVVDLGQPDPYQGITQTVGQYLGDSQPAPGVWSPHAELARREPVAWDGVVLHESYFDALGGAGGPRAPMPGTARAAAQAFGSVDSWLLDLRSIAGSTGGWALVCWDVRRARLVNVLVEEHHRGLLAGCPVLLAIDCWEHAYAADYGIRKDVYLGAFFRNVDWAAVEARLQSAGAGPALAPDEPMEIDAGSDLFEEYPEDRKFAGSREHLVLVERERLGRPWRYWTKPEDVRPSDKVVSESGAEPGSGPQAPVATMRLPTDPMTLLRAKVRSGIKPTDAELAAAGLKSVEDDPTLVKIRAGRQAIMVKVGARTAAKKLIAAGKPVTPELLAKLGVAKPEDDKILAALIKARREGIVVPGGVKPPVKPPGEPPVKPPVAPPTTGTPAATGEHPTAPRIAFVPPPTHAEFAAAIVAQGKLTDKWNRNASFRVNGKHMVKQTGALRALVGSPDTSPLGPVKSAFRLGGAAGTHDPMTGTITLQNVYARGVETAVLNGHAAGYHEQAGIKTLLHEQFHSASNQNFKYGKMSTAHQQGRAMEEATTELLAQHFVSAYAEANGVSMARRPIFLADGSVNTAANPSYHSFVSGFGALVHYADGLDQRPTMSPEEVSSHIAGRALQIKRLPGDRRYGVIVRAILDRHGVKESDPHFEDAIAEVDAVTKEMVTTGGVRSKSGLGMSSKTRLGEGMRSAIEMARVRARKKEPVT